jgi:uncharacterized protein YjdB
MQHHVLSTSVTHYTPQESRDMRNKDIGWVNFDESNEESNEGNSVSWQGQSRSKKFLFIYLFIFSTGV